MLQAHAAQTAHASLFHFKLYAQQTRLQLTEEEMALAKRSIVSNDPVTQRNAGVVLVKVTFSSAVFGRSGLAASGVHGCDEC